MNLIYLLNRFLRLQLQVIKNLPIISLDLQNFSRLLNVPYPITYTTLYLLVGSWFSTVMKASQSIP